ncbi:bifunctional tetrahydrofolate synthase/dihydrofolate synthase [Motilimonas eburnea]|uniref:bifunctional tetrahydrofolate synthase/dihydrofolate synthase n=1 Tax=Motilimonas eburnea TaxID=1737488 RepID=UPI001E444462|nr:bifunctional tetrahydrofolate synthase/dihydrofolate synthase [Motilimonas eburnea]MCE2571626.1 bifunctional tetrahydrofolate synthase/dihydrofolate synthase [Motilimonas eburnea]
MIPNSLSAWLSHLEQLHPSDIELGLTRVKRVAEQLGLTEFDNAKVVLVGGTNGKGTTCAMLESILMQAGYRVGVYSSPHLIRYTERVRVDGQELLEQQHCDAFAIIEQGRGDIALTYFEFGTLAALQLLKQAQCDVILLEVGLGGRLDATNIVEPDVSVVTTIDIDHVEWLGNNREDVSYEKAGIFRTNKPAICGDYDTPQRLIAHADHIGAKLLLANQAFTMSLQAKSWDWQMGDKQLTGLPLISLPLQNAATALATIAQLDLNVSEAHIKQGVLEAKLAGRMQVIQTSPTVILDVAHNPHSAGYLVEQLKAKTNGPILAVVGMLKDKDIKATLAKFDGVVSQWYLADLSGPRAASAQLLAQYTPAETTQVFKNVELAYQQAIADSEAQAVVIVFGSFYTVAEIIDRQQKG